MRPIKFRAWDKGEGRMLSVRELTLYNGINEFLAKFETTGDHFLLDEVQCVLMQFTGLVDKNGVEIWEGDVVKDRSFEYVVEYVEAQFDPFGMPSEGGHEWDRVRPKDCAVIGNIYENPELMK